MLKLVLAGLAILGGVATSLQAPINSHMRTYLSHPLQATFVSFLIGTIVAAILAAPFSLKWEPTANWQTAPLWTWIGGLLGVVFVTTNILVAPRLGVAVTLGLVIVAQMVTSAAVDHYGLFRTPATPLNFVRFAGIGLVIAGVGLLTASKLMESSSR